MLWRASQMLASISIHALRAESDHHRPPDRGDLLHFYPRSPCGERPPVNQSPALLNLLFLSTLSLRRATVAYHAMCRLSRFLSTLSLRRATRHNTQDAAPIRISIHALLAESDVLAFVELKAPGKFLSTLSLRRATDKRCELGRDNRISIHALLAESDLGSRLYDMSAA